MSSQKIPKKKNILLSYHKSDTLKAEFPDEQKRLKHIFENQVYGLAPTEIIFNIAKSYILGFDSKNIVKKNNLRLFDSLPYSKGGNLSQELSKLYENTYDIHK